MIKFPSLLTYDALEDTGVFIQNLLGDGEASFNGLMFETYGPEYEAVAKLASEHPNRVATLLDCDGKLYLSRGLLFVDRLGYFCASEDLPEFEGLLVDDGISES